ncbi:methyltransferase domain-containing protein [Sarocladium implicatum]|nr:methyltransferase domain-containing protein [Sarocladium implicatum]
MADQNELSTAAPAAASLATSAVTSAPEATPTAAAQAQASSDQIAVDPEHNQADDDNDSALGDDRSASTASISSSILAYRKLHGRTFHNFHTSEDYWGPNDEQQNEGMDLNHHTITLALDDKLYLAPLENPKKILDVGTGTGIWAIDMADEFPEAQVIGTDLSPTQSSWVPANCKFELDDASQPWTFEDNTFDYIHVRYMLGSFKDWVAFYKECYRCLKPGGYIEHLEGSPTVRCDDGSVPEDSVWSEWSVLFNTAGDKTGVPFELLSNDIWIKNMEEAGFTNIVKQPVKLPIGGWPADSKMKEIGNFNFMMLDTSLEGLGLHVLTNVMGWEYAQTQVFLARVREAMRNKSYHSYSYWANAYAQKPLE